MPKIIHLALAFVAAVVLTAVLSSIFSTQFVIAGLQDLGVDIPLSVRFKMTLGDLSILETLLMVISACFLIAFLIAGLCSSKLKGNRTAWYMAAGASAFFATFLVLEAVLQLMPIAGARTGFGLFTQAIAGLIGGYVFARLTPNHCLTPTNDATNNASQGEA